MNDFSTYLLADIIIIGTMALLFLRTYWMNIADKIGNKDNLTIFEQSIYRLYPFVAYFWVVGTIIAQYYKAAEYYFSVSGDASLNLDTLDEFTKMLDSKMLFNNWMFMLLILIYCFYVFFGIKRKYIEIERKLNK